MVQAAVIGLGKIGLMYDIVSSEGRPGTHALAYHLHPEIDFAAAVGVRREQGEHLAKLAPEAAFYLNTEEMLSRHKPDIVSICTPAHVRYDLIKSVLEQSSAPVLFCEKPVARSIEEARRISALMAAHKGRMLIPNLSRRWNEGTENVRARIADRSFGTLKKMHLRYTRGIYNSGAHLFDLVRYFAGTIDEVQVIGQVPTSLDEQGDWTYRFLFKAGGGRISGFAEAFDDRDDYYIFEMDLFFDRGKIEIRDSGDVIRYFGVEEHPHLKPLHLLRLDREDEGMLAKSNNMQNAVAHLVDVLVRKAQPVCALEDATYPLYVAEALIRSNDNGGIGVPVGETKTRSI
ncbi:Gfo/Idh/MocA family protein [Paenibacillus hodogayensis]|uniref:Gfo/Idh/MocA family protein n=1 Tax=Paenibacillus hodogayensis TaxID=279208 RepID=A0ABV5W6W6_9BACL